MNGATVNGARQEDETPADEDDGGESVAEEAVAPKGFSRLYTSKILGVYRMSRLNSHLDENSYRNACSPSTRPKFLSAMYRRTPVSGKLQ